MYYNPDSDETISLEELKELLNASIPEGEEQIDNWYLVHNDIPEMTFGYISIPDKIEEKNGKYVQTYKIIKNKAIPVEAEEDNATIEERISAIESGIVELAQMLVDGGRF